MSLILNTRISMAPKNPVSTRLYYIFINIFPKITINLFLKYYGIAYILVTGAICKS